LTETEVLFVLKYFNAVKSYVDSRGNELFYDCLCTKQSCQHIWTTKTAVLPNICPKCKGNKYLAEKVKLTRRVCQKCGHAWLPKTTDKPLICPKCKTRYWNGRDNEVLPIKHERLCNSVFAAVVEENREAMRKIEILECKCGKCNHIWRPVNQNDAPQICPRCKTKRWNL